MRERTVISGFSDLPLVERLCPQRVDLPKAGGAQRRHGSGPEARYDGVALSRWAQSGDRDVVASRKSKENMMRSLRQSAAALVAGTVLAAMPALAAEPLVYAPMEPGRMSDVIRTLASDPYEGRAPGTMGAIRTVNYIVSQFQAIGLEPAGDNGSWTQEVPMIHTRIAPDSVVHFQTGGAGGIDFHQSEQIYLTTGTPASQIRITEAPLVFVGYGVTAPARDWDDFKNVDLKGKIAVILINDPDFKAAADEPVKGRFGGRTMTYYGRWTYKYEEAARRGAVGALIVHDTEAASYPWSTVIAAGGEAFDLERKGKPESLIVKGWLEGQAAMTCLPVRVSIWTS